MTTTTKLLAGVALAAAASSAFAWDCSKRENWGVAECPYPENPNPPAPAPTPAPAPAPVATANPVVNANPVAGAQAGAAAGAQAGATGGAGGAGGAGGRGTGTGTGVGTVGTTVGTTIGGSNVGGSRSLGLSLTGVQMQGTANPGLTQCPDATVDSWSAYLFGNTKAKSGVDLLCLDKLGKQAAEMADKTAFWGVLGMLVQTQDKNKVTYALSAFRKANTAADQGAQTIAENIIFCPTLPQHPSFELLATQPKLKDMGFTCPEAPKPPVNPPAPPAPAPAPKAPAAHKTFVRAAAPAPAPTGLVVNVNVGTSAGCTSTTVCATTAAPVVPAAASAASAPAMKR